MTTMALPDSAGRQAPNQPSVERNAWDTIPVPELGLWQPSLTVSLVVPYYQAPDALEVTLAAISEQSYPSELLEVIVADDGSETPWVPHVDYPMVVRVVRQERQGFGLARARNLGAKAANGDILVFLDCDMVPDRHHIEAHARWHHQIDYAVVFGLRNHVDFRGVGPSEVSKAVREEGLASLFEGRRVDPVHWIDQHLTRTDWLRTDTSDPWRVTSGGNLSISRDFFWDVGGYDETFRQWGGEDNEFGYRTFANGAVIVPEAMALAWHQGEGHEPEYDERRSLEEQRPKLVNLIPDPTIRRIRPGRSYEVPVVTVHVRAITGPKEQTLSVVESVLSGRFSDLVVLVDMPPESPDLVWMERQFQGDARVRVGSDLDPIAEIPSAHVRVELPTSVLLSMGTLEDIMGLIWGEQLGAIHITNPNWDNSRDLIEVYTTRAWTRAKRLDDDAATRSALMGRLFGERWISGRTYGFFIANADGLAMSERYHQAELELRDQQLRAVTSRRSVRIADAIGSVVRARSWADFVGGVKQAWKAVLGKPEAT